MSMSEIIEVNEKTVKCDGEFLGEAKTSSGHPAVYLKIDQNSKVECPYCGQVFVFKN